MICSICQKEVDKAVRCKMAGPICFKCCFNISVASPEYITTFKKKLNLGKDAVLKQCGECHP